MIGGVCHALEISVYFGPSFGPQRHSTGQNEASSGEMMWQGCARYPKEGNLPRSGGAFSWTRAGPARGDSLSPLFPQRAGPGRPSLPPREGRDHHSALLPRRKPQPGDRLVGLGPVCVENTTSYTAEPAHRGGPNFCAIASIQRSREPEARLADAD
jgi:hypothetical protein